MDPNFIEYVFKGFYDQKTEKRRAVIVLTCDNKIESKIKIMRSEAKQ